MGINRPRYELLPQGREGTLLPTCSYLNSVRNPIDIAFERKFSPEAILFDLDGTLVDSAPDLEVSINQLMAKLGRSPWDCEQIKRWIGNGVEQLVERALTGGVNEQVPPQVAQKAVAQFIKIYSHHNGQHSTLFPGVLTTLLTLCARKIPLGVVTSKPAEFAYPLLRSLGIDRFFQVVVEGNTVKNKKPHPEPLWFALEKLGSSPSDALFVGDSVHDVAAGEAAGVPVICVSYGYNHGIDISTANPTAVLNTFAELEQLLA